MTAITTDQFDGATARLATDQADLKTELAALSEAQAAVPPAQAAADEAAQTLASAMQLVKVRQSAVDSTNADMKVQQTIISQYSAQTPPKPTAPAIIIAPPITSNPSKVPGSTIQIGTPGKAYTFTNRISDPNDATPLGLLYKTVGGAGARFPLIDISHHDLVGNAGIIRIQYEEVDELRLTNSRLFKGAYAPGQICGLVHIGHGIVHKLTMHDCEYDRAQFITSTGDIYAGGITAGGHTSKGVDYGMVENFDVARCRISHCNVDYSKTDPNHYQNSDGSVLENLSHDGRFSYCEFLGGADAGLDRKSPRTRAEWCIFGGDGPGQTWRENKKSWTHFDDGPCWSNSPRHAHHVITPQGGVGRIQGHTTYECFKSTNPNVPLFDIQRAGGNLFWDAADFSQCPSGQVLAICESSAYGSTLKFGDKTYTVSKGKVLL